MATYNTPGVYVEEISTLPPSVAQVATAIPAFIGYTEKGSTVARIDTLLDYETLFGRANPSHFTYTAAQTDTANPTVETIVRSDAETNPFVLYYALALYFRNGGGSCYIVPVGNYDKTPSKADFSKGLDLLAMEDEPTLILFPDAPGTLSGGDYYDLCAEALGQCEALGDRFVLVDVPKGDKDALRNKIGLANLMYGAAYHPYLTTTLTYQYTEEQVVQAASADQTVVFRKTLTENSVEVSYTGKGSDSPTVDVVADTPAAPMEGTARFEVTPGGGGSPALAVTISSSNPPKGNDLATAWAAWNKQTNGASGFDIVKSGDGTAAVAPVSAQALDKGTTLQVAMADLQGQSTALYSALKVALGNQRVVLPPSAAIAGIYARVDRERGVWKTPANVSVAAIIGPVTKISDLDQESLNIDPTAGKSINAIRDFTGKGTLVWGGRTLAGNDNEWRYISVRRLFITIEESTRKATAFAVFEPNDMTTWLKVKAMVESYLYGLWEQGALAGPKPEAAYFVNVGLGKTMTTQDILEGRMIVEIGVAAVRPAEFIILRFTHKMQEA